MIAERYRELLRRAVAASPFRRRYRIGKYFADYSPLTPEEIAEVGEKDKELEDLLLRSRKS